MNQRIQIKWVEFRRERDGFETYFVEATKSWEGWSFKDAGKWDIRSFPLPSSPRLVLIAERGRAAVLRGSFGDEGDLCLRKPDYGTSSDPCFGPIGNDPVTVACDPQASAVLAVVRFRDYAWLPDEQAKSVAVENFAGRTSAVRSALAVRGWKLLRKEGLL